jgi:aqualysin 1
MNPRRRVGLGIACAITTVVGLVAALPLDAVAAPSGDEAPLVAAAADSVISDHYIVVLRSKPSGSSAATSAPAVARARARGVRVDHEYGHALSGYAATLSATQLAAVRHDPDVDYVAADATVHADGEQTPAPWGLDRVDQRALPLNNTYITNGTAAGVTAFVIDTGIRATHSEFGGRVVGGADFVGDGRGTNDCAGHGTHVAGTLGGATYGVAKSVSLVPVRVLDCGGSGSVSGVVAGVDWVTAHHSGPSVANMSLGGGVSQPLDDAVTRSINSGVVYAIAAGNSSLSACTQSPARVPAAITVGASTRDDSRDTIYSNFGPCVTLFAPGTGITSAWNGSDTDTNTISGTSMATPHVSGVVALFLQDKVGLPANVVKDWIVNASTPNVLTNIGAGSPNRLLYTVADFGSSIAAARNGDGRLQLFGTNNLDQDFTRGQTAPGNWTGSGWGQLSGFLRSVAAETNADGRIEMFGVNSAEQVFHRSQVTPGGAWSEWVQFDGFLTSIAAARNGDGRLELFGANAAGQVFNKWQVTPGGAWSDWNPFDGSLVQVAAETNADGRIELFGVNSAGIAVHRSQAVPGANWTAWEVFDGQVKSIAVARNGDGRLELFATNAAGQVFNRWQAAPGGAWSAWLQFDGELSQVAAETNADGRLELFGVNGQGVIVHRSQAVPGANWTSWAVLDGALRP